MVCKQCLATTKHFVTTIGMAAVATYSAGAFAAAGGVPAEIDALQAAVQAQSVQLTTLQTSVSALQSSNTTLQATVASLQSSLASLQGQVTQLQAKDVQHDAAIASLNAQIGVLQAQLASILGQSCPTGQFVNGMTAGGTFTCAQSADRNHYVRHAYVSQIGIPDNYLYHTVAQLNLSAGKHVIHFNGYLHAGATLSVSLDCDMFAVHNLQSDLIGSIRLVDYGDLQEVAVPMLARADLATAGAILVKCRVPPGYDNAYFFNTTIVGWPVDDFL